MLIDRRELLGAGLALTFSAPAAANEYPTCPPQPFFANIGRIVEARRRLGEPFPATLSARLSELARVGSLAAVADAQRLLEPLTLLHLHLGSGGYALPRQGGATARLTEQGWTSFLVRVVNPDGLTRPMAYTLDTLSLGQVQQYSAPRPTHEIQGSQVSQLMADAVAKSRLDIRSYHEPPLADPLSGLLVEYRLLQLLAFSPGTHHAGLMAGALDQSGYVWAPSRKIQLSVTAAAARPVRLRIVDHDGRSTVASVIITDDRGNIYPSKFGRLAPDMYFQDQIYRADGETVRLPPENYRLAYSRGPEYLAGSHAFSVDSAGSGPPTIKLQRWVDPAANGWYSGDVHIHAAGCSHYNEPTVGVAPETIIRHVRGEGLWIGDVLTWGPGFQEQKRHFSGTAISPPAALEVPDLQRVHGQDLRPVAAETDPDSTIRYDLEISGFPSSPSGHLLLLRLKDQTYPGTSGPVDWPSWSLPILRWARAQGAVTGFAHCGFGLADLDGRIPSLVVPSFDSIGANEFLVDAAHDAVDFLSGGNTIPAAELTLWYHALNCGIRVPLVGETDWPCVSDDRVGMTRTYVHLDSPPRGNAGYDHWVEGLRAGKVYLSDGRAHIIDFKVAGHAPGEIAEIDRDSNLLVEATVCARLDPVPEPALASLRDAPDWQEPRWHLERARKPGTRAVDVEIIVNGQVAHTASIEADGTPQRIRHRLQVSDSSWIALRILPALHSHAVFIHRDGRPVRASVASADWCIDSVRKVKANRLSLVAPAERAEAEIAYDHALDHYRAIRRECTA